uniref:NAC protein n=1 Tax=Lilium pumilum TaxID=82327 RepID=A0A4Y1NZZ7_9LILI|nr:NAC protein [Lilium pumilum]
MSKDGHEDDLVMPGFRFHPTEEELIEFYLRRKVEGRRFNVELINFLDLYRYDPWELPAMAAIGEKEWFFYVPRDRKYRNGDRPNRVTTSGYWKATGADRMIRGENSRPIGLKKTLVFYSGKAPKGIRTSWIMNEYRLPHGETERLQKAEISVCRVYKRAVVDGPSSSKEKHGKTDQPLPTGDHSSSSSEMMNNMVGDTNTNISMPVLQKQSIHYPSTAAVMEANEPNMMQCSTLTPTSSMAPIMIDEINRIMDYNQSYYMNHPNQIGHPQLQLLPLNALPGSEKHWEWNNLYQAGRDYTSYK